MPSPPENHEIASRLYRVAELLDLDRAAEQRAGAYRRAADLVATLPDAVAELARSGQGALLRLPGIGPQLASRITELVETGGLRYLDELQAALPPGVQPLLAIPGLPVRVALLLHERLAISSPEGLREALNDGRAAAIPGMTPRLRAQVAGFLEGRGQPG